MKVSEHFYSIQGEGASVGVPAYFIRLQGCNLMCGGPSGSLMKEGKATWWCDSEKIWRKGEDVTNEQLVRIFKDAGIFDKILTGDVHLVWTGGEPTIAQHQEDIINFICYMTETFEDNNIYSEIETNGTIATDRDLYTFFIDQINCSPKLSNSGVPKEKRINPDAINQIKEHPAGYFKFVISSEDDIIEIQNDFIIPFDILNDRIIIMPGVDNRNDLAERTRFIFEMTKKYGYRSVTRQHILAWDKVTGV